MAGTVIIGSAEFRSDLRQMEETIGRVTRDRDGISSALRQIGAHFDALERAWQSKAGTSYDVLRTEIQQNAGQLLDLLGEMISRMRATYGNYENAERTNAENLAALQRLRPATKGGPAASEDAGAKPGHGATPAHTQPVKAVQLLRPDLPKRNDSTQAVAMLRPRATGTDSSGD